MLQSNKEQKKFMWLGKRPSGMCLAGEMCVREMPVGEVSVGEVSVGEVSVRGNVRRGSVRRGSVHRGSVRRGCARRGNVCRGTVWTPTSHTTKVLDDVSCLNEKLAIALHKDDNILNKRSEIISKCRYRNKYMLASYDSKD